MLCGTMGLAKRCQPHVLDAKELAEQSWEYISPLTVIRWAPCGGGLLPEVLSHGCVMYFVLPRTHHAAEIPRLEEVVHDRGEERANIPTRESDLAWRLSSFFFEGSHYIDASPVPFLHIFQYPCTNSAISFFCFSGKLSCFPFR